MNANNSQGLHSLATIIKRLEAAASRFEDIAVAIEPSARVRSGSVAAGTSTPYSPSSPTPIGTSPPAPPAPVTAATPAQIPESVIAFREQVIEAKLKPFVALTNNLTGASVKEVVALVERQYDLLLEFLKMAASCQKPTPDGKIRDLAKDLPPTFEAISRAKENGRRDRDWFDHLQFIAEGTTLVAWFLYPNPAQYVTDTKDSVVYYGNKLKKIFKEKDPKQLDWVNAYVAVFDATAAYVKKYHATGLTWNPKGVPVDSYKPSSSTTGAPPPPPPPPPPQMAAAPEAGGVSAVFAQLNRGEDVTKGLRKVDKSEMTHKNPALRAGSVVPASTLTAGKKPIKPTKPQALAGKKPPKFALEGNKWLIEYQEAETITVNEVEINQAVNIFNCKGTTIVIKGKVNTVNIYNCQKTSVLVQSVVASVGITASPSFQLQILGAAPMIQIDQTDSGQIYLSKESSSAEITTAKCSAINISLPVKGEEEGVFEEQPVPEMLRTVVVDGKLVTTVVEHSG
ncbi:adenylate cyclase associated N terminal-domain-containing protein [Panaeolus papilionaceus]|nr:adenylate cyclase associated N terminal-domain-containing protein [Panaeolus papilionaceus]